MSATQTNATTPAAPAAAEAQGENLLEQAISATRQTERSRTEDLLRTLTQEALKGTVTWNKNVPQTIKAGAAMRWMRLLKPRSAIGQTNLPVQACDQIVCAWLSTRSAASAGTAKKRRAASPSGAANSAGPRALSDKSIQFCTG